MAQTPATIGDFTVLPVSMPPLPSYPRPATHHIYLRRNAPKTPTERDSRSLFLANVPADSTEPHLRGLFAALVGVGRFESVTFEDERTSPDVLPAQAARLSGHLAKKRKRGTDGDDEMDGAAAREREDDAAGQLPLAWSRRLRRSGSAAVVVLADEKSAGRVLKAAGRVRRTGELPVWGEGVAAAGRMAALGSGWLRAHGRMAYPERAVVEASVNEFFAVFNRREQEAAELAKRLRNEPDEDGFVTVTRGSSRNTPARRREAEEARARMEERAEKKKAELGNFYRFQLRERKKAEQAELLKRFEEDRRKVSAMKEKRQKFRPEA